MTSQKDKSKNVDKKSSDIAPAAAKKAQTGRDLVTYDPLIAYLREIRHFPKLSREEEKELALEYLKNENLKAAYSLVSSNLWLVVKIARQYEKLAKSLLDLIQEGNIGLMEAVKHFNPHKGTRLPTYATWWIKAYIIRYILANWRLVKIGTTQAQKKLFFNLNKEKRKLEQEGFTPSPKLIAQRLNVKESEVVEMEQRIGPSELSVDAPIGEQEGESWHSILANDQPDSEEIVLEKETKQLLAEAINSFKSDLNEKYLKIFEKRLLSEDKKTLQELANELDISIERVRQIENKIKEKFRDFLTENYDSLSINEQN